jgi:hypothetical protein
MAMVESNPSAARAIPKAPRRVKVIKAPMAMSNRGTMVDEDPSARPWDT